MTNESNENLLKILLNKPKEESGTSKGEFIDTGLYNYWNTTNVAEQINYENYTIALITDPNATYYHNICLGDKDNTEVLNAKLYSSGYRWNASSMDIDEEGNLYVIGATIIDGYEKLRLFYINNITVKNSNGQYEMAIRKYYDLTSVLNEISGIGNMGVNMQYKLKKSPIDSRFVIAIGGQTSDSHPKNIGVILYHVNFEGSNDYEYRLDSISLYNSCYIYGLYTSWTDENVDITMVTKTATSGVIYTPRTAIISKITLDFSSGSTMQKTTILTQNNFVAAGSNASLNNACIIDANTFYIPINTRDSSNIITTTIYKYDGTLKTLFMTTGIDTYSTSQTRVQCFNINGQVFMALTTSENSSLWHSYFLHIIDENVNLYDLGTSDIFTAITLIHCMFNLYRISINGHTGIYLYDSVNYTGEPYFDNGSVTSVSNTIWGIGKEYFNGSSWKSSLQPVFSRNLYNKTIIGNVINAITQIPYNFLNNIPLLSSKLVSKTNEAINNKNIQTSKNMYEELYINNSNAYKVYDNNVGSVYNQDSSNNVAAGVFDSFNNNYKITKYRINYEDETYENKDITDTEINANIGTIKMYIYLTKKAKNIQLYDNSFTVPFLTIDISSFDIEKIYQVVQKIKVE